MLAEYIINVLCFYSDVFSTEMALFLQKIGFHVYTESVCAHRYLYILTKRFPRHLYI